MISKDMKLELQYLENLDLCIDVYLKNAKEEMTADPAEHRKRYAKFYELKREILSISQDIRNLTRKEPE